MVRGAAVGVARRESDEARQVSSLPSTAGERALSCGSDAVRARRAIAVGGAF